MTGDLYRKLIAELEHAGCRFVRSGGGSHQIWYSPLSKRSFTVPYDTVNRHTANGVLRQAGLPKKF